MFMGFERLSVTVSGVCPGLLSLVLPQPARRSARADDRADPAYYLRQKLARWGRDEAAFSAEALAEYLRCFGDPATIHASCEDYRAAVGIDLEHDRADLGRTIGCPLLVLWGAQGFVGRKYDLLATWRKRAADVRAHSVPGGHFLPEEAPEETYQALRGGLFSAVVRRLRRRTTA